MKIEEIKDQYCKFHCPYRNKIDFEELLNECNLDNFERACVDELKYIEVKINMCKYCQIDNFIKELEDYKII